MKSFLQTLFLFLLVTQICFAQPVSPTASQGGWFWQNPLPTGTDLNSVKFIDATTGWAVGNFGTILRTTNGGADWTSQSSGTTEYLFGVSFTDENNGTAVGLDGTILKTTNGGSTFVQEEQIDEIQTEF